jgi:hypothetical protein
MESQLYDLFGVPATSILYLSGLVWVGVELLKKKFAPTIMSGVVTDIAAFAISFGLALKTFYPSWEQVIACAIFCWLIPAGVHKARQ